MNTNEQTLTEINNIVQVAAQQEHNKPETQEETPKQNHHNSATYAARQTHSAVNHVMPQHRALDL